MPTYTDEYMDCKDEQQFKMKHIKRLQAGDSRTHIFCIETEETVKGFPDVMILMRSVETHMNTLAVFNEYKFTDNGIIKFQPAQIAFYKQHKKMIIKVAAFNKKARAFHYFYIDDLFNEESPYYIGTGNTLNLAKAEKDE